MTNVLAAARCPQCAALVRPGQPWCTLCHADLRPQTQPVVTVPAAADVAEMSAEQPSPEEASPLAPVDPLYAPLEMLSVAAAEAAERSDDLHGEEPSAANPTISDRDIEAMLAELAAQTADPLGGVGGRFRSRSAKVMLAAGVALAATAFLLLGAVVATAIFG